MELDKIIAISGQGGLFKIVAERGDGLIVSPLGEDSPKFVSSRIHTFTTLDHISIFKEDNETIDLASILVTMLKVDKTVPASKDMSDNEPLKAFFKTIVPEYDEEKVYMSDIKKIIKWYHVLKSKDMIKEEKEQPKKDKKESEESSTKKSPPKKVAEGKK